MSLNLATLTCDTNSEATRGKSKKRLKTTGKMRRNLGAVLKPQKELVNYANFGGPEKAGKPLG
jgi:hypothetical protein